MNGVAVNMDRFISRIIGYVTFFLGFLGLTYLFYKLWRFEGDSLIRNAVVTTIAIILLDLGRFLFEKFTKTHDNLV